MRPPKVTTLELVAAVTDGAWSIADKPKESGVINEETCPKGDEIVIFVGFDVPKGELDTVVDCPKGLGLGALLPKVD